MANTQNLYAKISASADNFNSVMDGVANKTRQVSKSVSKSNSTMTKGFQGLVNTGSRFKSIGSGLETVSQKTEAVGSKMTGAITKPAGIAATAVGGLVGALGFKRLIGMDAAQAKLKGLGYASEDVKSIQGQVEKAIQGSMTTMAEGTDIAAGGLASGVEEGKELEKYIKLVGDAAVGSGRPVNEMSMIFARIQGSGKVMTEELNMIEDGMPGFSKAMAEDLGIPLDQFREKVSAGEVTSEQFMTTMDSFAGKMSGAYSQSFSGMAQNVMAYVGIIGENLLGGVFEKSKKSLQEFLEWISSPSVQQSAVKLGESIGSAFSVIVTALTGAVKLFSSLPSPVQKTAGAFALLLVGIGPLLLAISKVTGVLSAMFGPLGTAISVVGQVGLASQKAGGFVAGLTTIFPKLGAAVGIAMGPVGWIIGGIIALGAAFILAYNKSETFRNFINGIGSLISGAIGWIKQLGQAIGMLFGGDTKEGTSMLQKLGFSEGQISTIQSMVNRVKSMFSIMGQTLGVVFGRIKATWNQVVQAFQSNSGLIRLIFTNMLNIIRPIFNMILNHVKIVFDTIIGIISGAMRMVQGIIQIIGGIIQGDWGMVWNGIKNIVMGAVGIIISLVKGLVLGIVNILVGMAKMIGASLMNAFNLIKGPIVAVFTGIWNAIKWATITAWNGIVNAVVVSIQTLRLRAMQILNFLKFGITAIWNGIKWLTITVWNGIKNAVIVSIQTLRLRAMQIFNLLKIGISAIWNGIKTATIWTWNLIRNAVLGAIRGIRSTALLILRLLSTGIKAIWNGIRTATIWAWNLIKNSVLGAIRGIRTTALLILRLLSTGIKAIWNGIKTAATWTWNLIKNAILSAIRIARNTGLAIFRAFRTAITAIWNGIRAVTRTVWNAIKAFILGAVRGIRATGLAIFRSFRAGITAIWNGIRSVTSSVWNWIKNKVIALARTLRATTLAVFRSFRAGITAIWNGIRTITSNVWNWIKNKVIALARTLRTTVINVFNAFRNTIRSIWNTIRSFTSSIWNGLKNTVVRLATGLRNSVVNTFNRLKNSISGIWNSIKSTASKVWNGIQSLIQGFANGIRSGVTGAFDKMKNALSKTIDKIKGFVQSMIDKVKGGLNKLIDGVNWVGDKLGMDKIGHVKMHTGTTSSSSSVVSRGRINTDTFATVGDKGRGNGTGGFRHETVIPPKGKPFITPNRDTLLPASKGTKILNGKTTQAMMKNSPNFASGTIKDAFGATTKTVAEYGKGAGEKIHGGYENVKEKTGEVVEGAKNMAGKGAKWLGGKVKDVMDFVENPGKLLEHILKAFGVNFDGLGKDNIPANMMGGMFKKLKDAAKNLIKGWLEDAEGGEGDAGWLLKHPIWQKFGNYTGGLGFNGGKHYGVDFGMTPGTDVKAVASGKVSKVWNDFGGGKSMEIDLGNGLTNWYMHLNKQLKKKGDRVDVGDLIAKSGNTGNFTAGSGHLHFQLNKNGKPQSNVLKWLKDLGGGSKSASKWKGDIKKAAKATGTKLSSGKLNDIVKLIATESNGNPKAVQGGYTDVNTGGNEARGLLQYTPRTWSGYKTKGGNIMNGYHQLKAFFNNSNWSSDLAAWKARMARGATGWGPTGSNKGYANGGIINAPEMAWLAEGGFSESVISHDPRNRARSKAIHDKTGEMLGVDADTQLLQEIIELLDFNNDLNIEGNRNTNAIANKDTSTYLDGKEMTRGISNIMGDMYKDELYNSGR